MEIIKIKKKKNNIYELLLSDNTSLSFYDDTIIKYNLLINKKINEKNFKEILLFNQQLNCYYKALNYLKKKLRTKKEIEKYLKKNKYLNIDINYTINRLEKQGYINDLLYLKSYINDQINLTNKGYNKIKNELIKLGFKEEEINQYLNEFDDKIWIEKINKIISKKINNNTNLTVNLLKNKILKDLVYLGYDLNLSKNLINEFEFKENNDILNKIIYKEIKKLKRKYHGDELEKRLMVNLYKKGIIQNFEEKIDINQYL
ncbi:MAG: hypothetical protein E7172_03945 [Firmicutes bacterium]|nr:hypothetical protein [Bacillota bacterium]